MESCDGELSDGDSQYSYKGDDDGGPLHDNDDDDAAGCPTRGRRFGLLGRYGGYHGLGRVSLHDPWDYNVEETDRANYDDDNDDCDLPADDGHEADDDVDRGGFVSFWRRKDRVDVSGGGRPTNLGHSNQDFDNPDDDDDDDDCDDCDEDRVETTMRGIGGDGNDERFLPPNAKEDNFWEMGATKTTTTTTTATTPEGDDARTANKTAKKKDPDAEGAVGSSGDAVAIVDEPPEAKAAKIERGPPKPPSATAPAPTDDDVASLSRLAVAVFRSALPSRRRRTDDNDDEDDDDRRCNRRFLAECDSSGAVERTLWPWFLRRASAAAAAGGGGGGGPSDDGDNDDDDDGEDEAMGREAAFALALLSNRRGGGESTG
ncbi:hypothetical protein ACHAW5_006989 [Stephanodiscus triporus]|uniref:Condensin complex subunit 2 n=1 Tax=Stephanodiscus triporus TaxID=2934178 RepID=A0ABD3P6D4_9STRA